MSKHHAPWLKLVEAEEHLSAGVQSLFNGPLTDDRINTYAPALSDLNKAIEKRRGKVIQLWKDGRS